MMMISLVGGSNLGNWRSMINSQIIVLCSNHYFPCKWKQYLLLRDVAMVVIVLVVGGDNDNFFRYILGDY